MADTGGPMPPWTAAGAVGAATARAAYTGASARCCAATSPR